MFSRRWKAPALLALALAFAALHAAAACDTALVIVDVQRVWLADGNWETSTRVWIEDAVELLLEDVRATGIHVIHIQDVSGREDFSEYKLGFPRSVAPIEGEHVVEKLTPSGFADTTLRSLLSELGVRRLIFAGLSSTGCLAATVDDARGFGYRIVVVEDAHSAGAGGQNAQGANASWRERGLTVRMREDIDFSSYCAAE